MTEADRLRTRVAHLEADLELATRMLDAQRAEALGPPVHSTRTYIGNLEATIARLTGEPFTVSALIASPDGSR